MVKYFSYLFWSGPGGFSDHQSSHQNDVLPVNIKHLNNICTMLNQRRSWSGLYDHNDENYCKYKYISEDVGPKLYKCHDICSVFVGLQKKI